MISSASNGCAPSASSAHPFDAELITRGYVDSDKRRLREVAGLYDPDVPAHENEPYVARVRELLEAEERELRDSTTRFGGRSERGWVPPREEDVEAIKGEQD